MDDFTNGFLIGSLIIGIVTTPFLVFFGGTYFNILRMEKHFLKESKKEIDSTPDPETLKLIAEAEKLLEQNVNRS